MNERGGDKKMGMYLNPGNEGFARARKSRYVDKSKLLAHINQTIDGSHNLLCISRPRRFGKSYAAQMLCAYYDKDCDSSRLFSDLAIAQDPTYPVYLNQYNVIYLDMTNIIGKTCAAEMIDYIQSSITKEILAEYDGLQAGNSLDETLLNAVSLSGRKFVMIIDEWDAPLRERPELEKDYLQFLRMLFKSSGTTARIFAAAYMTGILPIKKDGSESAISDFDEYTMLDPGEYQEFIGFTEEEVRKLCAEKDLDFKKAKRWYDGYSFDHFSSIYNPYSIMQALQRNRFKSYWRQSSAADALEDYIKADFDGLFTSVLELLNGLEIPVYTESFNNDIRSVKSKDDVLTMLIHLGYLAYNADKGTVRIPNEEIRLEFAGSVRDVKNTESGKRLMESRKLIQDTVAMDAPTVAAEIERVHALISSPIHYNNEQALRCTIQIAYYAYVDEYIKFEELPSGDGFVDVVFLPKRTSRLPALLIELKWNQAAEGAIGQIKGKHYVDALKDYGGEILLVGISYDRNDKENKRKHSCVIEKYVL